MLKNIKHNKIIWYIRNIKRGFTLIELLVVMAIFSFLILVLMSSFTNTYAYITDLNTQSHVENQIQYAMSYLKKIIRNGATVNLTNVNSGICNPNPPQGSVILCSLSGPLIVKNQQGQIIATIALNTSSSSLGQKIGGYITYNGNNVTNSNNIDIQALNFYYYNYNYTGTPQGSNSNVYIAPYVTILIKGCTLNTFQFYGQKVCMNLISSATLENYVYSN